LLTQPNIAIGLNQPFDNLRAADCIEGKHDITVADFNSFQQRAENGLLSGIMVHKSAQHGMSNVIHTRICRTFPVALQMASAKFGSKHSTQAILTLGAAGPGRQALL